jgi:hypothetical protein
MSQRSRISLLALVSSATLAACATSADPGFGGSFDAGKLDGSTGFDATSHADSEEPGIDTATPTPTKDSGTTKDDTATPPVDTGSTKTDSSTPPVDTGTTTDTATGVDTKPPPTDTAPPTDTGTTGEGTTGATCTSTATCDVSGKGINSCSNALFSLGPIYPSPVCVGVNPPECAADDGTTIVMCDGTRGVCLASGTDEICLPACTFDDSGAAPTGCAGKDACNVYGWGRTSTGALTGVGYCFGGCKADLDCPTGSKCQVEDGLCVTTKVTYTKTPGTACTKAADAGTVPTCNCLYSTTTTKGYCANFCTVGSTTCATGYKCSPSLPTSDSTGALWSKDPTGMAGYCLKSCTTDTDCTAINAKCKDTATGKVCEPG